MPDDSVIILFLSGVHIVLCCAGVFDSPCGMTCVTANGNAMARFEEVQCGLWFVGCSVCVWSRVSNTQHAIMCATRRWA